MTIKSIGDKAVLLLGYENALYEDELTGRYLLFYNMIAGDLGLNYAEDITDEPELTNPQYSAVLCGMAMNIANSLHDKILSQLYTDTYNSKRSVLLCRGENIKEV